MTGDSEKREGNQHLLSIYDMLSTATGGLKMVSHFTFPTAVVTKHLN